MTTNHVIPVHSMAILWGHLLSVPWLDWMFLSYLAPLVLLSMGFWLRKYNFFLLPFLPSFHSTVLMRMCVGGVWGCGANMWQWGRVSVHMHGETRAGWGQVPFSMARQLASLRDGLSPNQELRVLARLAGHWAQRLPISGSRTEETGTCNHTWPAPKIAEQGFVSRVYPLSHLPSSLSPPLCISIFWTSVKILSPVAMTPGILIISEDNTHLPAPSLPHAAA